MGKQNTRHAHAQSKPWLITAFFNKIEFMENFMVEPQPVV